MKVSRVFQCQLLILCALLCSACSKAQTEKLDPNPEPPAEVNRPAKLIHVYVALCDNDSQGIAPVPERIGNGDDPSNNLYWGCSDGARAIFSKSATWQRLSTGKVEGQAEILERLVFQNKSNQAVLVIDAWRGSEIETCMDAYRKAMSGQEYESLALKLGNKDAKLNLRGGADLLVFIGHNGLMEFKVPDYPANPNRKQPVDSIILCCKSEKYFITHLETSGATPLLLTASNMYPGAFILHDVLPGWFAGETPEALRLRAAKAYAKNQGISTKSAATVFAKLKREAAAP